MARILSLLLAPVVASAWLATMGTYPGYMGALDVRGSQIWVTSNGTGLTLQWNLTGLTPSMPWYVHIHSGLSCAAASDVGGHFWAPFNNPDPWNDAGFAASLGSADANGQSTGTSWIEIGYTIDDIISHPVVIHDGDVPKTRIGCGVLGAKAVTKWATLTPYPGYAGTLTIGGTVNIYETPFWPGYLTVNYRLTGLTALANGGLHVHVGSECATSGAHYWLPLNVTDPWLVTKYQAGSNGVAEGQFNVMAGITFADILDRTVVVHDVDAPTNTRAACGVLQAGEMAYGAWFGKYPGSATSLDVSGSFVYALQTSTNAVELRWNHKGLNPGAAPYLHFHTGLGCDMASQVGGHFWKPFLSPDPWNDLGFWARLGAADSRGYASGSTTIDFGYNLLDSIGHSVVLHDNDAPKSRIGCGVLGWKLTTKDTTISKYPGYPGTLNAMGAVQVFNKPMTPGTLSVNFRLTALNASANGGIHIHVGTTCATSGAHFWLPTTDPDPWLTTKYQASATGVAEGQLDVIPGGGIDLAQVDNRAVVIHDVDAPTNSRIACGTLLSPGATYAPTMAPTEVTGAPTEATGAPTEATGAPTEATGAPTEAMTTSAPTAAAGNTTDAPTTGNSTMTSAPTPVSVSAGETLQASIGLVALLFATRFLH